MDDKPLDQESAGSQENQTFRDGTIEDQSQNCPQAENIIQDTQGINHDPQNQEDCQRDLQDKSGYQQEMQENLYYQQSMQENPGHQEGMQGNPGYQQGMQDNSSYVQGEQNYPGYPQYTQNDLDYIQNNEGYSQNSQGYYETNSSNWQANQVPPNSYHQPYGQQGQNWNGRQVNLTMPSRGNGMSTTSMILGIISIVTSCCCCIGIILGGLGLMFGCLSKVDVNYDSKAKAGIITSVIGLILSVVSLIIWFGLALAGEGGEGFLDTVVVFQSLMFGGFL